jgi:DNA processing protein
MDKHTAYWISIAHIPKWNNAKINNLIKDIYMSNNSNLEEFFSLGINDWVNNYKLNEIDCETLTELRKQIPNNAFLAESLINQGFELIPINHPDYSATLKNNLKLTYSPPLLYIKGNKQLLKEDSIAVVGSRNANDISITFTDNVVKKATENYQVIVSGFAKGVDKASLDSAIKYHGHSVIVLPQGVLTFSSGFKNYYKQIIDGDVLVLSSFHPKAPWKTELAMARNPIIYGLAENIFVAESSDKGGTWSGVKDGLRKGRKIYIRMPIENESNANNQLISLGAIPVDMYGTEIINSIRSVQTTQIINIKDSFDAIIKKSVENQPLTAKEICTQVNCDWSTKKMSDYMKRLEFIEVVKVGKVNKYRLKGYTDDQQTLDFD